MTVVDAEAAAIAKDVAIVKMTGTILYQMYQSWARGFELGLA